MTSEPNRRSNARRRRSMSALPLVLALAATACGSSDDGDAAAVETGTNADESTIIDDVEYNDAFDDLEYGDSLEELTHASAQGLEPTSIAIPGFEPIQWEELIPLGFSSEEIFTRYEDRLASVKPGSPELDALYDEMQAEYDSGSINPELDGADVQLAGFVAPLTYDGDDITEFLLVPYFGACIHVPPPPTNQIVMVSLADGESLSLEDSWGAVWVAGTMSAATTDTTLATAGYSISDAQFSVYQTQ